MPALATTLVTDGSSDRALVPIIEFLLDEHSSVPYQTRHAMDLPPVSEGLDARIRRALRDYPCDLLFVHRDAESAEPEFRMEEVKASIERLRLHQPYLCVVPVRMTEAWLLVDEEAIRRASGNPNGRNPINVPPIGRLERLPDPKDVLRAALEEASNLPRRRRIDFNGARQRVSELMRYEALRELASFRSLEEQVSQYFSKRQH